MNIYPADQPYTGPCPPWCTSGHGADAMADDAAHDMHFAGDAVEIVAKSRSRWPGHDDYLAVEVMQPVLGDEPIVAKLWPSDATEPDDAVDLTDDECDALAAVLTATAARIRAFRASSRTPLPGVTVRDLRNA